MLGEYCKGEKQCPAAQELLKKAIVGAHYAKKSTRATSFTMIEQETMAKRAYARNVITNCGIIGALRKNRQKNG